MKTILCFGDSNTYGSDPTCGPRHDLHTRWAGVLRDQLGADWWLVEEGCGGRTTVWEDPIEGHKNGAAYLPACLHSHQTIDLVIIMLGTNDLKKRFGLGAADIAAGAGALVDICLKSGYGPNGKAPKVLLLAPPPVGPLQGTRFEEMFEDAEAKSKRFSAEYEKIADQRGCSFFDVGTVVKTSPVDGVHWAPEEHRKLALALVPIVKSLA
jgi:lysophospholipase L1-like esterase